MKLELGPGERGHADHDYIDIRPAYGIPFCFDMTKVLPWPIESERYDEVLAIHVIEHFAPRKVDAVFAEVFRVLKPSGCFQVHVPNGPLLANVYVQNPAKRSWLQSTIYGGEADDEAQYAYAHKVLYDFEMLSNLFARHQFTGMLDVTNKIEDVHDPFWYEGLGGRISLKVIGMKP